LRVDCNNWLGANRIRVWRGTPDFGAALCTASPTSSPFPPVACARLSAVDRGVRSGPNQGGGAPSHAGRDNHLGIRPLVGKRVGCRCLVVWPLSSLGDRRSG